ncbi:hypothetical protein OAM67_01095 [bacterium]|nr:hypothetical protein [bacterium]
MGCCCAKSTKKMFFTSLIDDPDLGIGRVCDNRGKNRSILTLPTLTSCERLHLLGDRAYSATIDHIANDFVAIPSLNMLCDAVLKTKGSSACWRVREQLQGVSVLHFFDEPLTERKLDVMSHAVANNDMQQLRQEINLYLQLKEYQFSRL